jgi:hypothetical protein
VWLVDTSIKKYVYCLCWSGKLKCIILFNEANLCAYTIVNFGCKHAYGLHMYEQCPARLSSLDLANVKETVNYIVISI